MSTGEMDDDTVSLLSERSEMPLEQIVEDFFDPICLKVRDWISEFTAQDTYPGYTELVLFIVGQVSETFGKCPLVIADLTGYLAGIIPFLPEKVFAASSGSLIKTSPVRVIRSVVKRVDTEYQAFAIDATLQPPVEESEPPCPDPSDPEEEKDMTDPDFDPSSHIANKDALKSFVSFLENLQQVRIDPEVHHGAANPKQGFLFLEVEGQDFSLAVNLIAYNESEMFFALPGEKCGWWAPLSFFKEQDVIPEPSIEPPKAVEHSEASIGNNDVPKQISSPDVPPRRSYSPR